MAFPKIYIGSDHAGFNLKNKIGRFLKQAGYSVEDIGPYSYNKEDDYPDYALKVCRKVLDSKGKGILLCGSGQGMDRAANKIPGIHAAVCWNKASAVVAKEHGNVNVLCMGGRFVRPHMAEKIVEIWLKNGFSEEERHKRRIEKINDIEKRFSKRK